MTESCRHTINRIVACAELSRPIRCLAAALALASTIHAQTVLSPNSQDLIVGRSDSGALLTNGYYADPSQGLGAGVTGSTGARYNRNTVIGFLLPTLSPGQTIDTASFRITISSNNDSGGTRPVALYGLSTANPNTSGTMLFATDTVAGKVANAGNELISANFSSTGSTSGTPQADVSGFIRSFYTGNVPHQAEVFFRICPTADTWSATNRLDFTKGSARLEITTVAGAPVLYRQTGSDPTFQQLIDNGVVVPGVSSGTGPVPGSLFRVNQTMLAQQSGSYGTIPSDIRIHTQVNSAVLRSNFGNFTRWYQEVGNVQVMRLFEGDQNIRSGAGPDGTPGRIEAFFQPFAVPSNKWSVWEGTYTIIDPLQSNIFQLFHEGGQLWAFHLRMTNTGTVYFARRRSIAGLPDRIDIATNMTGKSISFMVRSNGTQYELYQRTPVPQENWQLVTTGSYTPAVDREISYRWGMYYGSQAGESIPNDGLLFMTGVKLSTVDAPGGDPPPPPAPVPMTYYWDNNGATAGFGTASGVWGETTSGGSQGWSTDASGATVPEEVSTSSADTLFFGTNTSGRGLGTGTITVSDTVDSADITFGSQSGNITLNGGEIQMFNNRTITVGGGTQTIRSVLSGTGSRTIAGTGALFLTGENTFSGPLVVGNNSGGLRLSINSIANADGTPSAAGAPASSANGIIQLGQTSNGSTLELTGSTSAQSTNRQIRIGSNGGGSGGATIQNNNTDPAHTLAFTHSAFNVAATDNDSFNRVLTLRGSNTGDNLIQGAIINNIGGSGGKVALTKSDAGTWVLAGANTYTNPTTINGGTLRIGNGGSTGSLSPGSSITLANGATLEFRRTGTLTQGTNFSSGSISGSGALVQSGTGTTILNVDNTYSGLTTIDAGALRIQHASALGTTAAGTVVNGTAPSGSPRLELAGDITVTGEAITISGGGNFRGALSSQSGTNTWAGSVTITAPETRIGANDGATLRVTGVINSGGQAHGLVVRAGPVDTGAVVLSGANTWLGDTWLAVGKLQLDGGNNRLPVATRLSLGATTNITEFDLNGRQQSVAGLSIAEGATASNNSVNNSSATLSTLTVSTAAGSPSTFSGILKGNLALVKTGPDALVLSGANTHVGGTNMAPNSGTLHATITQTTTALGTGPVSIGSGSTLWLDNQSTTSVSNLPTIGNAFTGTGLVKLQFAAGTTARNTYMTGVNGFGGTIQLSNTGETGDKWNATSIGAVAASVVVDAGSAIYMSAGSNSFAGGITLNGAGNSENRGALRLSGATTALDGSIRLASDATIGMESTTARITGNITSAAAGSQLLTLGGSQGSQAGGRLEANIGGGTGSIGLRIANGNYTLAGINTYTGDTTISAGTLQLAADARLTFVLGASSGVNNRITGGGTAILNGEFAIDTTAADTLAMGAWILEEVTTLTGPYGSTFRVAGFTDIGNNQWEKALGPHKKYIFDETTGTLNLTTASTYETWAAIHAGGQAPDGDFDFDGVANGVEFFLNAPPGFTTNPQPDANHTITWTNGGNIPASAYGTRFVVQTSGDLVNWTDVPVGQLTTNTDGPGGSLTFTLSIPDTGFVRLKVAPE